MSWKLILNIFIISCVVVASCYVVTSPHVIGWLNKYFATIKIIDLLVIIVFYHFIGFIFNIFKRR